MAEAVKDLTEVIEQAIKRHMAENMADVPECEACESEGQKVSVQSYGGNSGLLTDSKSELSVSTYNGNTGKLDHISQTEISVQSYSGNAYVVNPMSSKGDEGYTYQRFNGINPGEIPMGNWQRAKATGATSTPGSAGGEGIPVPPGEYQTGIDPMVQEIINAVSVPEKPVCESKPCPCGEKHLFIAKSADVVGDVRLGDDTSVWYQAVLRGDQEPITVGARSNIQDGSVVHVAPGYPTVIGDGVTIGHHCTIHGCTIEDDALIGMGSTILNGAHIGKNCIVGAKSLVTQNKSFPDGTLIMGSPAKVIRALTPEEIGSILENAEEYVRLMDLEQGKAFCEDSKGVIKVK